VPVLGTSKIYLTRLRRCTRSAWRTLIHRLDAAGPHRRGQGPTTTRSHPGVAFSQEHQLRELATGLAGRRRRRWPARLVYHRQLSLTGGLAVLGGLCAGPRSGRQHRRGLHHGRRHGQQLLPCAFRATPVTSALEVEPATRQPVTCSGVILLRQRVAEFRVRRIRLVHIEAKRPRPRDLDPPASNQYTLWQLRQLDGRRQPRPLAPSFAASYCVTGGEGHLFQAARTPARWRDSKVNPGPLTCPSLTGSGRHGIRWGKGRRSSSRRGSRHPQVHGDLPVSPQPASRTSLVR